MKLITHSYKVIDILDCYIFRQCMGLEIMSIFTPDFDSKIQLLFRVGDVSYLPAILYHTRQDVIAAWSWINHE